MASKKTTVLFVGAFRESAADGALGGQAYACRTLVSSPISRFVEWLLLDTTMESLPPPPFIRRGRLAILRMAEFLRLLVFGRPSSVLIFASAGFSFVEKGALAVLARLFGRRVVLSPRSGLIQNDLSQSRFMRRYLPWVMRHCNAVICQSESWSKFYQSSTGLPQNRFHVIRNWIDAEPYQDLPPAESACATVLFMGWVERNKGIYELVEAVERFQRDLAGVRFIICGKGSELTRMRSLLQEKELFSSFEFWGWVSGSRKLQAFQKADIVVLPSHSEGLPNAVLEAMAAGRAVIASRVGGIPEVISHQEIGRLVEPRDVNDLGSALVELCSNRDRTRKTGLQARQHVLKHFQIGNAWPQLLGLLKEDFPRERNAVGTRRGRSWNRPDKKSLLQ